MADGFEVIPDELEWAAGRIGEALGDVAGMAWQGPGGDYGHPAVGTAWSHFLEEIKDQVDALHDSAVGHGVNLRAAATHYREMDIATSQVVGNCWLPNGGFDRGVPQDGQPLGDVGIPAPIANGIMDTSGYGVGIPDRELDDEGIHH
jgi:broad specificity phosphatase PhoE